MFRLIYRQRRRILFTTFLMTLVLFMAVAERPNFFGFDENTSILEVAFVAGGTYLIFAMIVASVCIVWLCLFTNWRFMIEQAGLIVFVHTAFSSLWPAYTDVTVIGPFLPIVVFFTIFMLAYGTALDRFPISVGLKATRSFISRKSADTLWGELVPTLENKDTHWDSLLHKLEADPEAPETQLATYHHGASIFQTQRQAFTERDAPKRATYIFDGEVSDQNKPITGGTYSIALEPISDKGTRVTLTETHDALLPRVGLHMWFDDALGDTADALRAKERGKSGWSLSARYRRKAASLS